ncbi:protein LATE ELONGATED HYPOCOTYL-like isoform X2 [Phoenix dactylifera]|uniref:Protein LATE ELONGATED HYPOCOTYL-like isoform X2 n=1 Tax=Phoenix dactylifera TaxID=42345 RepID=A0A8B8JCN8_PHODC|nr:protein LATE ELONGATED HYPOCOTYL-like isoform X2 [Phoenix dactylifera]XP_026666377.2 protein LATE ELONGATED HYPOCOTYL-like isoform X2 [Phoenix dactylifera]
MGELGSGLKLEKEAVLKGIPPEQAHDIDIPPPRPKRKPSSPYPRKSWVGSVSPTGGAMSDKSSKSVSLVSTNKQVLDMGSEAPQKKFAATVTLQKKEVSEDRSCSEVLNFFHDAPSASISSVNKSSSNPYTYMEFVPKMKEIKESTTDKSSASVEVNKDLNIDGTAYTAQEIQRPEGFHMDSQTNLAREKVADTSKQQENLGSLLRDNMQGNCSNSKQVPVHLLDRSGKEVEQTTDSDGHNFTAVPGHVGGAQENSKSFISPTVSATPKLHNSSAMPCIHQSFPALPPFTMFHGNQDAYRSFLNLPTTFSSLIMSTLLQNPAVHAAASLAASFWPSADVDSSADSTPETLSGGFQVRHTNHSPSLASIAAATVAAASAWWATQGLLPLFPPQIGFTFNPAPTTTIPTLTAAQAPEYKTEGKEVTFQNPVAEDQAVNPDQSMALNTRHPSSKSSSEAEDLDDSGSGERSHCTELKASRTNKFKPLAATGFNDSDETKIEKKPDRSSCGSNTPSSSEVETDTILDEHEKVNDEAKQACFGNPSPGQTNNRRSRSNGSISEEGRLAFQALFSREVLPQSFSPPHTEDTMAREREAMTLPVDLNKACATTDLNHLHGFTKEASNRSNDNTGNDSLTSEIGQGKLKSRRTGFRPYKRCSMEAKENRTAAVEETGNKRVRLEGEAST